MTTKTIKTPRQNADASTKPSTSRRRMARTDGAGSANIVATGLAEPSTIEVAIEHITSEAVTIGRIAIEPPTMEPVTTEPVGMKPAIAEPMTIEQPAANSAEKSALPIAAKAPTKLATLEHLLGRDGGASIAELMAATSWQAHSVRGAIAGALRKRGHIIVSDIIDGSRRYRIVADDQSSAGGSQAGRQPADAEPATATTEQGA